VGEEAETGVAVMAAAIKVIRKLKEFLPAAQVFCNSGTALPPGSRSGLSCTREMGVVELRRGVPLTQQDLTCRL
jgi:hypothetical protein